MPRRHKEEQWAARHEAESALLGEARLPGGEHPRALKRRKIRVVAAVQGGMISLPQALERFGLSVEEYLQWERDVGKDVARTRHANKKRRTRRF
jgi:hypothetical protein